MDIILTFFLFLKKLIISSEEWTTCSKSTVGTGLDQVLIYIYVQIPQARVWAHYISILVYCSLTTVLYIWITLPLWLR